MKKRIAIAALAVAGMASSAVALSPAEGANGIAAALTVSIAYAPGGSYHAGAALDSIAVWAGAYETGATLAGYDVGWLLTA